MQWSKKVQYFPFEIVTRNKLQETLIHSFGLFFCGICGQQEKHRYPQYSLTLILTSGNKIISIGGLGASVIITSAGAAVV